MQIDRVEFRFRPGVDIDEVEATTKLAFLGASGQHPTPIIRLYATYRLNRARRCVVLLGATDVVASIAKILTVFLAKEFGESSFNVATADRAASAGKRVARAAR